MAKNRNDKKRKDQRRKDAMVRAVKKTVGKGKGTEKTSYDPALIKRLEDQASVFVMNGHPGLAKINRKIVAKLKRRNKKLDS